MIKSAGESSIDGFARPGSVRKSDQPFRLHRSTQGGRMFAQYRRFHVLPAAAAAVLVPALLGPGAARGYGYGYGTPPAYPPPASTPPTASAAAVPGYKQTNLVSD